MSDFEAGMLVGVLAGVWAMVALEKLLGHWLKVRVVTVEKKAGPCEQVWPDEGFGVDEVVPKRGPVGKVECGICDGTGVRPYFPGNGYKGPNKSLCGMCHGTGWMTPPPKKP